MQKLVEDKYGHGGIKSPKDRRDYRWVGGATAPFDWSKGFSVDSSVMKLKNQYQAYSCGGEASSYYMPLIKEDINTERSAKFIYAPIAVPGGGSSFRDICNRLKNVGSAKETLCPSYLPDGTTTESFMTASGDINSVAMADAENNKISGYVTCSNKSIDEVASMMEGNNGAVLLLTGSNNGTWLSPTPKPPRLGDKTWNHYVFAVSAQLINGVKTITFVNSWGPSVGIEGRQTIPEDYFTSGNVLEVRSFTKPETLTDAQKVNIEAQLTMMQRMVVLMKMLYNTIVGNATKT